MPARIDVLTSVTGLELDEAWSHRETLEVDGRALPFLSRDDLIRNKSALGLEPATSGVTGHLMMMH